MEPLFDPLFRDIRDRLAASPGQPLQLSEAPLRESAVLVPLFSRRGVPHVLFTKRPSTLRTHGGQISFPGGARDPADPSPLHTALRETQEELGIPPDVVQVLGMLDETPTITQFRVAPFVGVIPHDLSYVPSPHEIEEIIEVPLAHLLHPKNQRVERWEVRDEAHDVYFFDYGPHVIWGATARILRTLLQLTMDLPSLQALRAP